MSYEKVKQAKNLMVGTKQTLKMVEKKKAIEVYVAQDADPRITAKVVGVSKRMGIPITYVDSMKHLGKACGIEVGAAVVAAIKE